MAAAFPWRVLVPPAPFFRRAAQLPHAPEAARAITPAAGAYLASTPARSAWDALKKAGHWIAARTGWG
jgi:hypothetical protein